MFENASHVPYVFAAGRGLRNAETLSLLRLIAERLNATVAATRGAVEEGLLDEDRMIGMSGKRIYTDLYVSFGVSGSNFHTAGIKGDPYIIAVNTDPHSRMFELADCCICEDARTVLERLEAFLQNAGGSTAPAGKEDMIALLEEGMKAVK